ncbi:MAG: acetyl-CoA carboxylase biotin carboxyl carrier protein [Sphingomonadaceae bacterium]|nr:acetyl-CoA carboxylase biotin carboxyl carrier protein [Sphingomonadaceae bacterium]
MTDSAGPMQVDTNLIRELAELLDATNLTEIEVHDGDRKIRVARKPAPPAMAYAPAPMVAAAAPEAAAAPVAAAPAVDDVGKHPGLVRAPIVGTAYLTPDPNSPPYVSVGSTVKVGATLLIIEAMKVMNPITATRAGTVTRILVSNEQPVEYDEPLIVIE